MNRPRNTSTYAQNLRLRKIQNRRFDGHDKFSVGSRGEPIPGVIDPVTAARKARRTAKRPMNLKERIKKLEQTIVWNQRKIEGIEKLLKENKTDKKLPFTLEEHKRQISIAQARLLETQQSLAACQA